MGEITVDAQAIMGPLEIWRHSVGYGGISPQPLPDRVVEAMARLRPRLVRIFIQEFFAIYPDHGRFDWSKLDPYMDALARTGAKVVAAITIKPKVLYPEIDHAIWKPRSTQEWQHVIGQLVRRYSVEKPVVTHWEIGNEPDIGEAGGCPYLICDPGAYGEYYALTTRPILEVFPQAKVGGPATAAMHAEPLPGFLKYCQQTRTQLDFVSWHLYHNDPSRHAYQVTMARLLASELRRPLELMVTEWSKLPSAWNRGASAVSVEDQAFNPRRAAMVAAAIVEMYNAGLDWSFYYHLWDQVCHPEDFAFFSPHGVANMVHHWNEAPHRLGLFGVGGEVRPHYFVYQMLLRLGEERLAASSDDMDVRVLAGRGPGHIAVLAVNHSLEMPRDRVVTLRFLNLQSGARSVAVYRIDKERRWDSDRLELLPVERRKVYVLPEYECQVLLPADSVALIDLIDR
jgi:xylan 1,4-beta-xylosidase